MRLPDVFLKTLRDLRWQVLWYGLGLALMAGVVVFIYPSYSRQMSDFDIPEALQALIGDADWGTGTGFISAEMLSWTPIVLVIFAITSASSALAAEESDGTLDLLLAMPIARSRLFVEKMAGLLAADIGIVAIMYCGWLVSVPFVDIDVGLGELAVATANQLPLVFVFQAFTLFTTMNLPSKGLATGAAVAFAVVSYFIYYLGALVDALEPFQQVSVFYHYHGTEVLDDGLHVPGLALLLVLFAAFTFLAWRGFEGRDIGAAAPPRLLPWSRQPSG
jgi:ABC-2 type transport system permease protein